MSTGEDGWATMWSLSFCFGHDKQCLCEMGALWSAGV